MAHTTAHKYSVLVEHPNGILYISRTAAEAKADGVRAYWKDFAKTVLVIVPDDDAGTANGYEYGGKKSYNGKLTVEAFDSRNQTRIRVPIENLDRTGVPVREPGGAKVMQLKPLTNRKSTGCHIPRPDRLWRPSARDIGRLDDTPAQVQQARQAKKTRH